MMNKLYGFVRELSDFVRDPIYIKKSLGKGGNEIDFYKFRSMGLDADDHYDAVFGNGTDEKGKPKQDFRVTKIGRFLRKFWLDEIPQFYNWLKGEIKLVGIRPMTEKDWSRYSKDIEERAQKQEPGLGGVNYASMAWLDRYHRKQRSSDPFENHLNDLREYLDLYDKTKTADLTYFTRIFFNIIGGMRSS